MGCCGSNRRQFHTTDQNAHRAQMPQPQGAAGAPAGSSASAGNTSDISGNGEVTYEYIGTTAITVRGAATGNIYRFRTYGDRVAVDARDAASVDTVPNIRRV